MMKSVSPALHSFSNNSSFLPSPVVQSLPNLQLLLDDTTASNAIKELEKFDWTSTEATAKDFLASIINLVSYNGCYIPACFNLLVQGFIPKQTDAGYDLESSDKISHLIHTTLERILTLIPLSMTLLGSSLKEQFPHKRNSPEVLFAYLKNLLLVSYYAPSLIEPLLTTAVDRLIQIDVDIKLEDVPESEEDLQFEVEIEASQTVQHSEVAATKLDAMMIVMFEYLDAAFGIRDGEDRKPIFSPMTLSQNHRDSLFNLLLQIFDKYVLTTYKSKYTQFLLFYVCRLKAQENNSFSAKFMAYLYHKVQQRQFRNVNQLASSAYLGSFLSRASYLPDSTIREVAMFILNWTLSYLNTCPNASPDAVVHGLFYSMAQSLYYIFCFHHKILASEGDVDTLKQGYRRLTESKLNPLKLCLPTIVREFVRVSAELGWCDFAPLLKQNEKVVLPTRSSFGGPNQLEMFFPFDPYLLKHSSQYINDLYTKWTGPDDEDEENDDAATPAFADDDDSDSDADDDVANDKDDESDEGRQSSDDMEQLTQDFMHFTPDVEKDLNYHFSFD